MQSAANDPADCPAGLGGAQPSCCAAPISQLGQTRKSLGSPTTRLAVAGPRQQKTSVTILPIAGTNAEKPGQHNNAAVAESLRSQHQKKLAAKELQNRGTEETQPNKITKDP
jgi:hypothetical protein